jgi:hypothetical protein
MLWWLHARRIAAVLDVSAALRDGRIGARSSWDIVTRRADVPEKSTAPLPGSIEVGRQIVQAAVRDLFDVAAVRLVLGAEPEPALSLTGDGLRAALAVQVALRISGAEGVAICAECGAVVPDRMPDTRRAFCEKHRTIKVRNKWAARDHRRRTASEGDSR